VGAPERRVSGLFGGSRSHLGGVVRIALTDQLRQLLSRQALRWVCPPSLVESDALAREHLPRVVGPAVLQPGESLGNGAIDLQDSVRVRDRGLGHPGADRATAATDEDGELTVVRPTPGGQLGYSVRDAAELLNITAGRVSQLASR